jgi:hypothetical protein
VVAFTSFFQDVTYLHIFPWIPNCHQPKKVKNLVLQEFKQLFPGTSKALFVSITISSSIWCIGTGLSWASLQRSDDWALHSKDTLF